MEMVVLGYSVIEDRRSLQVPLTQWAQANGHALRAFGFGGLNLQYMPHMLDIVADQVDLTDRVLILDVCTPRERDWFGQRRARYDRLLLEIADRLAAYRCRPVFLYLYRSDANPEDDPFRDFLGAFAARHGIVEVDLARAVHDHVAGGGAASDLFRDVVHTTPEGADFYMRHLEAAMPDILSAPVMPVPAEPYARAYRTLAAAALADVAQAGLEVSAVPTRHGFDLSCVVVREGQTLTATFEAETVVGGTFVASALVLAGPESGAMAVTTDGEATGAPFEAFDEYSYYPHVATPPLARLVQTSLSLTTLAGTPPTARLSKGEWAKGPRVNRISHLLIAPRPKAFGGTG